ISTPSTTSSRPRSSSTTSCGGSSIRRGTTAPCATSPRGNPTPTSCTPESPVVITSVMVRARSPSPRSPSASSDGVWVAAGPAAALARLEPLIAAHRRIRNVVTIERGAGDDPVPPPSALPEAVAGWRVVGPRRLPPRRGLTGLWLGDARGGSIPVGWLPDVGEPLRDYAGAAARILTRDPAERALVVLGQWENRFLRVGLRAARWMERHGEMDTARLWTADRIARTDMLSGLACGPALAIYFGHGRPRGWAAYHGVRHGHFPQPWPEPMAALLALCCENASPIGRASG